MGPQVEQPGAIVPVPAGADDDDGDGPGADVPDGGGGGGILDYVDEDDPPAIEGAPAPGPRMSQRERKGVLSYGIESCSRMGGCLVNWVIALSMMHKTCHEGKIAFCVSLRKYFRLDYSL